MDEPRIDEPCTAAERWGLLIMKLVSCDRDLRTVAAWVRHLGVSRTALREACRLVRVSPRDARDFARMLRAIWRSGGEWRPESVLNVADVRTLRKLEVRAGFERSGRRPPPLETFLDHQTWIAQDSAALLAIRVQCRHLPDGSRPALDAAGAVDVISAPPQHGPRWSEP